MSGGVLDDISAWFSIDWQYNGKSLGVRARLSDWLFAEGQDTMEEVVGRELAQRGLNVRISNIGTNDAVGWSLHVRAQIMDDNILYEPGGCAALRVCFHYRFNRGIGADNIAMTEVHLYGDGTYETSSQWVQSSTLALGQGGGSPGLPLPSVGDLIALVGGQAVTAPAWLNTKHQMMLRLQVKEPGRRLAWNSEIRRRAMAHLTR